jgi:hypothetical protein
MIQTPKFRAHNGSEHAVDQPGGESLCADLTDNLIAVTKEWLRAR